MAAMQEAQMSIFLPINFPVFTAFFDKLTQIVNPQNLAITVVMTNDSNGKNLVLSEKFRALH